MSAENRARLILLGGALAGVTEFAAQWWFPLIVVTMAGSVVLALRQLWKRSN